jgi:hypothetical protein
MSCRSILLLVVVATSNSSVYFWDGCVGSSVALLGFAGNEINNKKSL